jgi:uncharacterized protein (DUF2062 family)
VLASGDLKTDFLAFGLIVPHIWWSFPTLRGTRMKKRYLKLVKYSLKALRHPRLRHRRWWQVISKPIANRALWIPCRDTVANGLAIGLFFSVMMIPFQSLPSAVLAMRAKANVPFALAACWISNPFTSPAIILGQFALGQWMRDTLGVPMPHYLTQVAFNVPHVGTFNLASFMLGMIVSGVLLALCAYPIVHLFSALMPHHLPVRRNRHIAKADRPVAPSV